MSIMESTNNKQKNDNRPELTGQTENGNNPFQDHSPFNAPLRLELLQQIHFEAVRKVVYGQISEEPLPDLPFEQWRDLARQLGAEVCLVHPAYVINTFEGVTLAVYQFIEQLYCDPLNRNFLLVCQILGRLVSSIGMKPIEYEAIWAICTFLQRKRAKAAEITTTLSGHIWHVVYLEPKIKLLDETGAIFRPHLVCILNLYTEEVIAFRVAPDKNELKKATELALYDALVSERRPSRDATRGIVWYLPRAVVPEEQLAEDTRMVLKKLGIYVLKPRDIANQATLTLRGNWDHDLRHYTLWKEHFIRVFDNFLEKFLGYSPLRVRNFLNHAHADLVGYQRDPAAQFPALRELLPVETGRIDSDGILKVGQQHYQHWLLQCWINYPVIIRRSEHDREKIWVYVDDLVVCEATAYSNERR